MSMPTKNPAPASLDSMRKELLKLSVKQAQVKTSLNPTTAPKSRGEVPSRPSPAPTPKPIAVETNAIAELRRENDALKQRIAELEREADTPLAWSDQQREFEQLLDEKSETIRMLNMQLQELTKQLQGGHDRPTFENFHLKEADLEAKLSRLRDDEEALKLQLREMEMGMAKERAELARQRSDMQRMSADLQRELEMASRDPALRERLNNKQQRRPGSSHNLGASGEHRRPPTMTSINLDEPADLGKSQPSGLFRRLLGG